MSTKSQDVEALVVQKYRHGFVTDIEAESLPPGLDEDVIRALSRIKREPQFLCDWRLKAFRHWQGMREPTWAQVRYKPIDYQAISYYSAPRKPARVNTSVVKNTNNTVMIRYGVSPSYTRNTSGATATSGRQ